MVYGIDPGPDQSAMVGIDDDYKVILDFLGPNRELETILSEIAPIATSSLLAIEFIQSYGMAVGQETFVTCRWIGRFEKIWNDDASTYFYARPTIKAHLCQGIKGVKDKHVRQALIQRLGSHRKGGPLANIKKHKWSALAVAVTCKDGLKFGIEDWMNI